MSRFFGGKQTRTDNFMSVVAGLGPLSMDAWGRQKTINDHSLFHGMCTYDVPDRVWEEFSITAGTYAPLAQTGTLATSTGNMLNVASGTTANNGAYLRSKRNPRYQPNRGHLYSTACILPTATADGIRRFGVFGQGDVQRNGVYFELEGDGSNWALYAVRESNGVVKTRQQLTLPSSFDPEKGHVYDIQYQWRGLGNYFFYVDLELIYSDEILGTLDELSMRMPAAPAAYESITHTTTEIKIQAGCVDITSEGGQGAGRQFATISTGDALIQADATGRAMIAIYVPRTLTYDAGTVLNTRDLVLNKLTGWCRDEAAVEVYYGRDNVATNLAGLTWGSMPDSTAQFLVGGELSALDTAFQTDRASMQLVLTEWHDLEQKNIVVNPSQGDAPFYATPGDIVVAVTKSIAGDDDAAMTLYLAEEV